MFLQKWFRAEPVLRSSGFVLKTRLCLFSIAWVHLGVAAAVILSIDMSGDEDPRVRAYSRLKWRFITAWFNLINLAYFPVCLFCDWKEMRGEENESLVGRLRRVRDIVFTSILFPTTIWADFCFWRLYYKDLSLIAPPGLFIYISHGWQHSLHTVSLVMVAADLVLVPRRRPDRLKPRVALMTAFFVFYGLNVYERYRVGEMVYALLGVLSTTDAILFVIMCYMEYLLYFRLQWFVIDYLYIRVWEGRVRLRNKSE